MNLDLREYTAFPVEVAIEAEADNIEYGIDGISFRDLMTVKINIQKVQDDFYCQGVVTAPVEEECSRCLTLFDAELSGDFSFIIKSGEEKPTSLSSENGNIFYVKRNEPVIELNDVIRESLILALPLKPLCDQDCKGLCPNCGVNLNEETCDCVSEESDERWEGLKDLLE
jgi:uncharacterized protein